MFSGEIELKKNVFASSTTPHPYPPIKKLHDLFYNNFKKGEFT